ncbi:MAG: hypothetical protein AAF611_14405 [Bacteroidota bacterium]
MKNNLTTKLLVLLLFLGVQSYAQDTSDSQTKPNFRQNEIRLDVFDAAFFSAIDVSYERVSDSSFGYGLSLFTNLRDPEEDAAYYEKFAVTPFFRFYFFNKEDFGAKGLFAEVFTKFASGDNPDNLNEDYFDTAIGFTVGKKWVNRRGFIFEFSIGGGRNIGLDDNSPEFTFRGGISLGYRF